MNQRCNDDLMAMTFGPTRHDSKGDLMRYYTQQHKHYCGIDLRTRMMYVCIPDACCCTPRTAILRLTTAALFTRLAGQYY